MRIRSRRKGNPARPCEKQRHKPPRGAKIREQRDSLRRSEETRSVANVRIFATRRGDAGTNANTPQNLRGVANDALRRRYGVGGEIRKEHKVRRNSAFCGIRSACEVTQGAKSRQRKVRIRSRHKGNPACPCEKQRHKPPRGAKIREQRDSLRRSGETRSVANVRIFATRRGDAGTNANTPQKLAGCCKRCLAATNGAGGRIRTADLFITSESLCLLSHTSLPCFRIIANPEEKCNRFRAFVHFVVGHYVILVRARG